MTQLKNVRRTRFAFSPYQRPLSRHLDRRERSQASPQSMHRPGSMSILQAMRFLLAVLRRNDSTSQANLQWNVIVRHETGKRPISGHLDRRERSQASPQSMHMPGSMNIPQPTRFLLAVLRRNDATNEHSENKICLLSLSAPLISSSRPKGEISSLYDRTCNRSLYKGSIRTQSALHLTARLPGRSAPGHLRHSREIWSSGCNRSRSCAATPACPGLQNRTCGKKGPDR